MKSFHVALVVAILGSSGSVFADTISSGSSGVGFQTFGTPNENGTPFWDQQSMDGSHKNIGYLVNSEYGSLLPYWGKSDGKFDKSFSFTRGASSGDVSGLLKIEIAGYHNLNEVGWYEVGNTSNKNTIWSGSDGAGVDALFNPTTNWGLYIISPGGTFYSESGYNTGTNDDKKNQHFAVFLESPLANYGDGYEKYYIGVEDLKLANSGIEKSGDYNDFVFTIQSAPEVGGGDIPEPASLSVLGLGAAALLIRRRKA